MRYRLNGQETSTSLNDPTKAEEFRRLVDAVGPVRAVKLHGIERAERSGHSHTVAKWVEHYIANLSGVDCQTPADYRGILGNDIRALSRSTRSTGL